MAGDDRDRARHADVLVEGVLGERLRLAAVPHRRDFPATNLRRNQLAATLVSTPSRQPRVEVALCQRPQLVVRTGPRVAGPGEFHGGVGRSTFRRATSEPNRMGWRESDIKSSCFGRTALNAAMVF